MLKQRVNYSLLIVLEILVFIKKNEKIFVLKVRRATEHFKKKSR